MVVIVDDLNLRLELVNLSLHELLGNLGDELKIELNKAAFHDFFTVLDGLLLALLDNFPKLIAESIGTLMKLFLSLLVFSHVRVFVRENVKVLDKFIENCLFSIACLEEF